MTPLSWTLGMEGSEHLQHPGLPLPVQVFLTHKPQWPSKRWILSPAPFERTVGLSYISQRCLVAASTLMFKLEKEFQTSFCLTLPRIASSELLFIVALRLGAQPSIMHRKQMCLSTASSTARHESLTFRHGTGNTSICWIWTMPLKCPENKQWWNRVNLWTSLAVAKSKSESRNVRHIGKLAQTHCWHLWVQLLNIFMPVYTSSVFTLLVHWMGPHGFSFRIKWRPCQLSPDDFLDFEAAVKSLLCHVPRSRILFTGAEWLYMSAQVSKTSGVFSGRFSGYSLWWM